MKSITTIGRLTVLFHRYYDADRDVLAVAKLVSCCM